MPNNCSSSLFDAVFDTLLSSVDIDEELDDWPISSPELGEITASILAPIFKLGGSRRKRFFVVLVIAV